MKENPIILSTNGLNVEDTLTLLGLILEEERAVEKKLIWGISLGVLLLHDGIHLISMLKKEGIKVMADAQLYGTPFTMNNSIRLLELGGADIISIHGLSNYTPLDTIDIKKLAGITTLSSFTNDISNIMACKLIENNCYGYVYCSGKDLKYIKDIKLKKICSGIRPDWYPYKHDHSVAITPQEALNNGATYIIIGRPIINSDNPIDALLRLNEDLENISVA